MYPRNAASPERIAIGAVVLIADGTVQTSGVSITVVPQGGTTAAGGGTTSYEQGVVFYLPTQAETNYSSFIVTAYKASCIPVSITVVTTASATSGKVVLSGETHTGAVIPTVTTLTGHTPQTGDNYARLGAPAGASVSADVAAVKAETATVLADTNDIQTRIPAALVGGRIDSNLGAISADATAADNLEAMLDGTGGVNLNLQQLIITAGDALPNIVLAGTGTADGISFTRTGSGNPFDADFAAQLQQEAADALTAYDPPTNAEMAARTLVAASYATPTNITAGTITTATNVTTVNGLAANVITAAALATDAGQEIADAVLLRKLDRTGTGTDATDERTVVNALRGLRNKVSISGGTATVTKEDDTTTAWTATVTTAAGNPISAVDPT